MFFFYFLFFVYYGVRAQTPWVPDSSLHRLPGVDDIQSGYNAAKMLTASDQNSKFQIFDLSEESSTIFKINVAGKEQSYLTPLHTQVTEIGKQRRASCESISYDFQHFYERYFQSTTFSFGVGIPMLFSLSIQYSETLKRVHDAMNKRSQAVATSSIWWGMYSIQLPPPFLLKFHPMFTMSVAHLSARATNPSTEAQQLLYNQFIEAYGTHYVSRVIVGGTAHLYTFVNDNYHKKKTYEEISEQIGLMLTYKEFQFTANSNSQHIYQKISEDFKQNSNSISDFQPPVAYAENQSEWQTWTTNAGQHPVVINRTLSHIAELIIDEPEVEAHLRRTIDFYLDKGYLPTLAQLQSSGKQARLLRMPVMMPISGLDVVGCGYDPLMLESRLCLLDTTNMTENEHWSDPYNQTVAFSLPNGFFAVNTPESLTIDATVTVTSAEDYFKRTSSVSMRSSGGFLGFGRKHTRTEVVDFYRRFYNEYYNMALRLKQIGWYTLAVSTFPYPKLNPTAEKVLSRLPDHFDSNDTRIWKQFFNAYGTHVVVAANMGGTAWSELWYEKCLSYEHSEHWVNKQVEQSFWFFGSSQSKSQQHQLNVDEKFKKYSTHSSQLLGGTESIDPADWDEWIKTIKYRPRPISYRLIQLNELLPSGKQRVALAAAIDYFLKEAINEDRTYVAELEKIRGPPPTQCSHNPVNHRKKRSSSIGINQSEMTAAQSILCPYVGYAGKTCTGLTTTRSLPTTRSLSTSKQKELSISAGMTLDITTGNLLLPAIEFTYRNTTSWIDPFNNETYWSPEEVTVLPVDAKENLPIARVFHNPKELANEWKYERLQGTWLGGEFGHSKSIIDLYNRFFTKSQATAITQKPTALYRVRLENLRLNRYARAAVDTLTHTYNEELYTDFINRWGTHIVQQAVIGGMHEQQIVFKDCIFSFNGAITLANLDAYLKQDILSQTLGNPFYVERRKIMIDHKLGGDPSIVNETLWRSSIPSNPALLKIEHYTPWYDLIQNPIIKENLMTVIQKRAAAAEAQRLADADILANEKVNERYLTLEASIGVLNNGRCEITPVILDNVANCSEGCSTRVQLIKSTTDFTTNRPLSYVRDPATGFVRARAKLDSTTILDGPRIDIGCSTILTPASMHSKSASICVGCTLMNIIPNQCKCECPTYLPS